jgi:hypothetical protein
MSTTVTVIQNNVSGAIIFEQEDTTNRPAYLLRGAKERSLLHKDEIRPRAFLVDNHPQLKRISCRDYAFLLPYVLMTWRLIEHARTFASSSVYRLRVRHTGRSVPFRSVPLRRSCLGEPLVTKALE